MNISGLTHKFLEEGRFSELTIIYGSIFVFAVLIIWYRKKIESDSLFSVIIAGLSLCCAYFLFTQFTAIYLNLVTSLVIIFIAFSTSIFLNHFDKLMKPVPAFYSDPDNEQPDHANQCRRQIRVKRHQRPRANPARMRIIRKRYKRKRACKY